jgi:inhibitor of KinA
MQLLACIVHAPFEGFQDISIAYNSLTVFYDPVKVFQRTGENPFTYAAHWLHKTATSLDKATAPLGKEHVIPVCYEPPFSTDLDAVAQYHNASPEEIVYGHQSTPYYVFMVGFTPGFPYLGLLSPFLDTPRKSTAALRVRAGSVGIAGRQTGIYSFDSPGGWNIIGRTPLRLFNINDPSLCLLKAGDTVRFSAIDKQTFYYLNQYADS